MSNFMNMPKENPENIPPPPPHQEQPPQQQQQQAPPPPNQLNTLNPLNIPPPPPQEQIEVRLVNQGAYGCVYKPEITCDENAGDNHYISKIQLDKSAIKNELMFSELLQKIPNFEYYFAPLLNSCPVSISKIKDEEREKCKVFTQPNQPSNGKYISTKIRYVGSKNVEEYILSLPDEPKLRIKKIYTLFHYVLKSIEKINQQKIIHYDIKEKNIMYDETNHSPIIIDFGLSLNIETANESTHESMFYTPEFYPYWCIDTFILSYIVKIVRKSNDKTVTEENSNELVTEYIQHLKQFTSSQTVPFTEEEIMALENKWIEYLKTYISRPWEDVFNALFVEKNYASWDTYSAAMTFMIITKSANLVSQIITTPIALQPASQQTQPPQQVPPQNPTPPAPPQPTTQQPPTNKSSPLTKLVTLWKSIILAEPNARPSYSQVLELLPEIIL
jgi:serine/threonine protein kinase